MKVSTTSILLASLCGSAFAAPVTVDANADVSATGQADVEARQLIGNTVESVTSKAGGLAGDLENDVTAQTAKLHLGRDATVVVNGDKLVGAGTPTAADQLVPTQAVDVNSLLNQATGASGQLLNTRGHLVDADVDAEANVAQLVDADVDATVVVGRGHLVDAEVDTDVTVAQAVDADVDAKVTVARGHIVDANVDADVNVAQLVDADVDATVVVGRGHVVDADVDAKVNVAQAVDADVDATVTVARRQIVDATVDADVVVGQLVDADVDAAVLIGSRAVLPETGAVQDTVASAVAPVKSAASTVTGAAGPATSLTPEVQEAVAMLQAQIDHLTSGGILSSRDVVSDATGTVESTVKGATGVDVNGIVGGAEQKLPIGNL